MASEDYMNLCGVIYDQLRQRIERVEGGKFGFVTRGTAAEVLHDENLKHLLRSLGSSRFPMEPQLSINEDVFVARIKERVLHDFLAILIFARCSIAATERFVTKFIAVDEWGLGLPATDKSALPAKHRTLKEIFENIPDADSFFANQAYFCALVLRKREEVRIESRDHQRPPYLDQSLLAEGAFGKVYRVRIAKGHFCDRSSEGFEYSTKTLEVARKDYIMSSEFPATSEREIMEKIFNSSAGTCKNIVENLGSLAIGKETYSLFMPLAICDLSAYMLHHYPVKPETTEAKADIIRCAVGLANGLKFLHTGMKTNDMDDLVCYHMDLKPSNVLIFRELDADGRPQFIWKLSDFGMARVKLRRRGQGADRVKDFNRFFKMRKKELNLISTMSKTVNRHGEGTYLAPESLSSSKSMGIGSDVWSLGCIISIVFAYLEDGSNGVIRYQDERSNHHTADGYDRFFVRAFVFRSLQVNPVVGGWHKQLIAKAMRRSIKEGEAVKGVLKNLEAAVFNIDPDSRCSAGRIMKTLQEAFKQYRSLQMEVPGSTPEQRRGSSAFAPSSESFWRIQKTSKQAAADKASVNEWYLTSADAFKGCAISPDARLVAYWNDTKIVLYSTPRGRYNTSPADDYTLEQLDCVWKSVDLMGEYLVACTTGRNYCYIFNLEKGSSPDVSLKHFDQVALPVSGIHKVAISPDGERLVCIVWHGEARAPSSILYAQVSVLRKWAKHRTSLSELRRPNAGPSSPDLGHLDSSQGPWSKPVPLEWPAGDVTHLSVSNTQDIYLVVRPELTARSFEHKIPIIRISLEHSTIDILNIESRGFDSRGPVGFFTAFCPWPNNAACAVVTREKRIQFSSFIGAGTVDVQKDIPNYRILKLMMSSRDDRLFALGSTSAKHKILLLELKVPQSGGDVTVMELAQLPGLSYGDDFAEMMSDENGEKYFVIAALLGTNRRLVYGVSLGTELAP